MKSFDIKKSIYNKYACIIYSLSYINPIEDIQEISIALRKNIKIECDVLFDLLLTNGEEFNRFVLAHFDGENLLYNTFSVVKISDSNELLQINKYYKIHTSILSAGILTSSQIAKYV